MTLRLVLRPQAEAELLDARDWYEDQRPGLGGAFAAEVDRVDGTLDAGSRGADVELRSRADRGSHSRARGCSPRRWADTYGKRVMAAKTFRSRAAERRHGRGLATKLPIASLTTVLAFFLIAEPLAAEAQQAAKVPRIGLLDYAKFWDPLFQRLAELGYVEGRTIVFEYRASEGRTEWLPALAQDLVQRRVDVIVTYGTPPTQAAKEATRTIPIVMTGIGDPVKSGLVTSLGRPGGNITGNTILGPDIGAFSGPGARDAPAPAAECGRSAASRGLHGTRLRGGTKMTIEQTPTANLVASRFWLGHGFRPVEHVAVSPVRRAVRRTSALDHETADRSRLAASDGRWLRAHRYSRVSSGMTLCRLHSVSTA